MPLRRGRGSVPHTTLGIGYEAPWRQVEAMLLLAAERTPGMLSEPAPSILQRSLGDYAVNYELNVYCDNTAQMYQFYTALQRSVLDVFREYGVQIMTPSYVADPAEPKVVRKRTMVRRAGSDGRATQNRWNRIVRGRKAKPAKFFGVISRVPRPDLRA